MDYASVASPYSDDFQGDRLREADEGPREAGVLCELCELIKRFRRTRAFASVRRFTPTRGRQ